MNNSISYRFRTSLWFYACLLPLAANAGNPAPPPFESAPVSVAEYRVAGVTSTKTNGNVVTSDQFGNELSGYAAMDRLCQVEVDPNARAATAREWQSARRFALPADFTGAWLTPGPIGLAIQPPLPVLHPDTSHAVAYTTSDRPWVIGDDASALQAILGGTCWGYSTQGASGIAGNLEGVIRGWTCQRELNVACAALVAVPVRP